ncbi:MAG: type III pantothenate kinase [Legionellales bacterium]|nr:type III pantothenate kinase [Legionellales bacterium]
MILCLDVGNTHIFGGLFDHAEIKLRFRHNSRLNVTSDEIGVFLKTVLRENEFDPKSVDSIAIASVVPSLDYSLRSACLKYFDISPFLLEPVNSKQLIIDLADPNELGADRLADCIAAMHYYPKQELLIVDMGTATTFDVVSAERHYLGGSIIAGLRLSMDALQLNTSKLSSVEILKPQTAIGRTTAEHLQTGLYYGQVGIIKELTRRISDEAFNGRAPLVIGTGGFAYLFEKEGIFTHTVPDLVLQGIRIGFETRNVS